MAFTFFFFSTLRDFSVPRRLSTVHFPGVGADTMVLPHCCPGARPSAPRRYWTREQRVPCWVRQPLTPCGIFVTWDQCGLLSCIRAEGGTTHICPLSMCPSQRTVEQVRHPRPRKQTVLKTQFHLLLHWAELCMLGFVVEGAWGVRSSECHPFFKFSCPTCCQPWPSL